ncbi:O-antigen ligase family protein [bacterium]|nr:O-antigen ligase family protein [bacterium]
MKTRSFSPIAACIHIFCLAAITLAMTAYTHNLDDIKALFFYFAGPVLFIIGAGLFALGEAPRPNRWIGAGLVAYFWVLIISTLFSRYSYAGWDQLLWWWSAFGFFVSAMAIGSSRRSGEVLLRGLVVLILVVNLVGFFMYDFAGNDHSGVGLLMQYLYGSPVPTGTTQMYRLLRTLSHAAGNMQSTILSPDFYSAVCLFYLPLAMFLAVKIQKKGFSLWQTIGFIASLTLTATIFVCFSRFHYPIWLLCVCLFSVAFFTIGTERQRIWLIMLVVLMFACGIIAAWFKYADLMKALSLEYLSSKTLATIWSGAWGVFTHHPILGGGPGTFGIYFPDFRDPNYYQYGISHVTTYAHNQYLDLLSETGIVGFAAFVVLLFGILRPIARGAFSRVELRLRGHLLAGFVAVLTILCVIFVSPISRWVVGAVSMWTILGLAAGWALQQPAADQPAEPSLSPQRMYAYAAVALGLILLPLCAAKGARYYGSALPYAHAVSSMEPAFDMMEKNPANPGVEQMITVSIDGFTRSIEVDRHNYSPYYKLGSVYMTLCNFERSKAEESRSEHNELEAQQHDLKADDYLLKSKNIYEKLAAMNPHYAQLDYNLGLVYSAYVQVCRREAEKLTGNAKLMKQGLASVFVGLAEKHFAANYKLSNSKEAVLGYGKFLLENVGAAKALKVFQAASDNDPKDPDFADRYLRAAKAAGNPAAITKATARANSVKP